MLAAALKTQQKHIQRQLTSVGRGPETSLTSRACSTTTDYFYFKIIIKMNKTPSVQRNMTTVSYFFYILMQAENYTREGFSGVIFSSKAQQHSNDTPSVIDHFIETEHFSFRQFVQGKVLKVYNVSEQMIFQLQLTEIF